MATVTDSDLKELKDLIVELRINQAKMDEKLDSISDNLADLKKQSEKQDNRLWVLISGMFLALLGFIVKISVNP